MKILFMGTDAFAVPSLEALAERHQVVAVITRPDKPKGRGRIIEATPVKISAEKLSIPVLEPVSLKSKKFRENLAEFDFDLVVLVAYGKILPDEFLDHPRLGCICLHPSKLPRYRGCSPIESAILDGCDETGVSVFHIDTDVDTGDVIYQEDFCISDGDTGGSLRRKMSMASPGALLQAIEDIETGKACPLPQNPDSAVWAPKITREDARIRWEDSACSCRNRIRAMEPKPGAYTTYMNSILKVHQAEIANCDDSPAPIAPGTIIALEKNRGMVISCGVGCLVLTRVQPQGKKEMDGWAFVNGYHPSIGDKLGE